MLYDAIIIGAGPAGLMAANVLKNKKILVIDKNYEPGRKLLITGGGRCNLTNNKDIKEFIKEIDHNQKYLYSTLTNFGPQEVIKYFSSVGLKTETDDKVFPKSNKSQDILNKLTKNINDKLNLNETVLEIKINETIQITTNKNKYQAKNILIATGGTSFKKFGSSGDHAKFAKMLGHTIIPFYPCETGIITKERNKLSGTAVEEVSVKFNKHQFTGNLMFTINGLSGSAIMKSSEFIYLEKIKEIIIDFLPSINEETLIEEILNNKEKTFQTFLNAYFSKKLSIYLIDKLNIDHQMKIKSINRKVINETIKMIKNLKVEVEKVNDIDIAYVTGGGINLKEIDTKTFESKIKKNVYFAGECLDVHGPIGGYNITLALSTGYSASTDILSKL